MIDPRVIINLEECEAVSIGANPVYHDILLSSILPIPVSDTYNDSPMVSKTNRIGAEVEDGLEPLEDNCRLRLTAAI